MAAPENPFVFGEIIDEPNFINRTSDRAAKTQVSAVTSTSAG
jgi:hypothetical protein